MDVALRGEGLCTICTAEIRGCVFDGESGVENEAISAVQGGVGRNDNKHH